MGNQQTICCADTTGRLDLESTSSSDGLSSRKPRLLRRFIDTVRPASARRDQIGPQQPQSSSFFRGKFASSKMDMDSFGGGVGDNPDHAAVETRNPQAAIGLDDCAVQALPPPPRYQLRSLSSMSTSSGFGERAREARTDRCFTRRTSYCSDREGIEDERERLEPEGSTLREATE